MANKYELFRSSLSVPMFENINQSIFQLLQTPEYQEYTDISFFQFRKRTRKIFWKRYDF